MSHSTQITSNNLASSSPHLLKQLTSGMMTVSSAPTSANSAEDMPPCKKLKLDIDSSLNSGLSNNVSAMPTTVVVPPSSTTATPSQQPPASLSPPSKSARLRLLEKRQARRLRLMESYKDNMSELFFLQSKGNLVDLPAFRKRPSQQYLNFLKSNNVSEEIMGEVRLAVLGPNASNLAVDKSPLVTVSSTSGRVTVSSAAMAAAMVAVHGSNWRPLNSAAVTTTSSSRPPPYSPRSSLLSPVKFGDQLQPFPNKSNTASSQAAAASSYGSYRLPSYTRDNLQEKVRQEAWVSRRVNDLAREGLWSDKRLPKVCERPRPRTHWDSVLSEMQWLSVDFHEERQWKLAAAKMLAYSAQSYVRDQDRRRRARQEALQKRHRNIAKFMADQVELFWQSISPQTIHSEKTPNMSNTKIDSLLGGEASSESGVCNLDEETDEEIYHDEEESSDFFDELDDESTIEEQETFEALNLELSDSCNEVSLLQEDNSKAIDEVLASGYPGFDLTDSSTVEQQHDSSISSEEEDDDNNDVDNNDDNEEELNEDSDDDSDLEDYLDYNAQEQTVEDIVLRLPLSGSQRKLYDDYLSSSQGVLDSLDANRIASVLQTLRKICNHPQLLEAAAEADYVPDSNSGQEDDEQLGFHRVIDGLRVPRRVVLDYDPLEQIDLASLNLVFFTHESTLTAITSDRIRKCCASKTLIEELPSSSSSSRTLPPQVPLYHFQFGTTSEGGGSLNKSRPKPKPTTREVGEAFHQDSLNVIAKFNERRCNGMPLYGQDLIDALTIVSPNAICSPPRMSAWSSWKGSGYIKPQLDQMVLPPHLALQFWPFFGAKRASYPHRSKHWRSRWLKNADSVKALSSATVNLTIHSDLILPPKVQLVAGFNRTHLALTSKHLAVEQAVKWARSKQQAQQQQQQQSLYPHHQALFKRSAEKKRFRDVSSKLSKLDGLLQEFRRRGERALIFCQMPEMLDLLGRFLHSHQVTFAYLDPMANIKQRLTILEEFASRNNFSALLTAPAVAAMHHPNLRRFNGCGGDVCNVVFFDGSESSNGSCLDQVETLEWCRSFNSAPNLRVYKLVCEDTVEDSLSIKALQQKLVVRAAGDEYSPPTPLANGPICKIKKHALEALFNHHFGDNGILSGDKNVGKQAALEEILEDPEVIAQLDWLWSNKINTTTEAGQSLVELSQQVDKGCVKEELKPIEKYARDILLPSLLKEGLSMHEPLKFFVIDPEEMESAKLAWEEAYQKEIALLASELESLERMEPQLTYCREDASRSWHGLDGQPMPLWTPPIPFSSTSDNKFRVEEHLSYLYEINLMEEVDLPPVYVKKELLKRPATESINDLDKHHKVRKEDGFSSNLGGTYAPRSLFDRHPAFQKQKQKAQHKRPPLGSGSYVHGPLPANFQQAQNAVSGLRHPIPRQQVEAENQPEWLIQEDWALLHTIKDVQGLPLTLNTMSPAHTVNWDLVSDMVNAVSRVYRGPRQCRHRFETIIAPREEGRILYDMPTTSTSLSSNNVNNKKKQKNKPGNLKLPNTPGSGGSTKMNKPMKTSQIFNLDKNNSWSSLFANRFETIKAVANKRSPTTKPLVVNPAQKNMNRHAAVLAEAGITYEAPLNPIQVAANRAERIQKEKQKQSQEQAAQLNQQRVAAAQAAANAVQQSAAATARVAIVQQPNPQQQQQAVVVGIPASSQQQVRQVINQQSVQELVRSQQQQQQQQQTTVVQQQQQQPTVVVTSQPPVVSVGSLPSQLAHTLKQAKPVVTGGSPGVTSTAINPRSLTPQQINILKQQALLKRTATEKAKLQGLPTAVAGTVSAVGTLPTSSVTTGGQKVSIAVTPSGVTLATIANSMPVTVVTQALGGQQKTQLIRGVPAGAKGNLRMTEADMKLLLASKQQLQQKQVTTSQASQGVTQLLQGIQAGQQVTTLVKSQAGGNAATSQSVTIPVQMQSLQGIKTIRQTQQPMVQLRHQLVQSGGRSKIMTQGGQTILATSQQGQKVALSQVAASGAKGVPAQLIVSSGNAQKPVTVQQIHQIKGQAGQGQQLIPHNLLKAGQGQSTVQARVIPATVAGRPQQIHVVAAPAASATSVANAQGRQGAPPNVTVDASGRPSQIRVAAGASQQLLNQVLGMRTPATTVIPQATAAASTTKLQVVQAQAAPSSAGGPGQQPQQAAEQQQQQNG